MQNILLFLENHWMLSLAFLIVLLLLIIAELIRLKKGPMQLSPQRTTEMINHHGAVIVDIRPHDAFMTGHIIDAISIPLSDLETKYKKLEKFKTQPIVLVSTTGLESPPAVKILKNHQINSLILAGGIRAWRDADLPLVKD